MRFATNIACVVMTNTWVDWYSSEELNLLDFTYLRADSGADAYAHTGKRADAGVVGVHDASLGDRVFCHITSMLTPDGSKRINT